MVPDLEGPLELTLRTFLTIVTAAIAAFARASVAATFQLPDATVTSLGHSWKILSIQTGGQGGATLDEIEVHDSLATSSLAIGDTIQLGTYHVGDAISQTFFAPAGMEFVFTPPTGIFYSQYYGILDAGSEWFGTGYPAVLQTPTSATLAGFQGAPLTVDKYSLGDITGFPSNAAYIDPSATLDLTAAQPFSFTSMTVTMPITGSAGEVLQPVSLQSIGLQLQFDWNSEYPQGVLATDSGPLMTLQALPEPTAGMALIGVSGFFVKRRKRGG